MNKPIKGFEHYTVDENGVIVNTATGVTKTPTSNHSGKGYWYVDLYNNGLRKRQFIHRLVADAFIANPDNKPFVNHIDGNPANNHISNLEWCTIQYNTQHAYDNLGREGNNGGMNKRVALCDLNWNVINEFDSFKALANHIGLKSGSAPVSAYFDRVKRLGDMATIGKKYRAKLI